MKIAVICPSNIIYMPYLTNYKKVLKEKKIDYTIINWDRFHIENDHKKITYRDKKVGHGRNYFDYLKYKNFIIKELEQVQYDKIIVFTLQLSHFLKRYLLDNYKGKYIIDIRDYNKIFKFSSFKKLINNSVFTVISSYGYKEWLPISDKYIINHNTSINTIEKLRPLDIKFRKDKINIYNIGVIRHWSINTILIEKFKNSNKFNLGFYGEGTINERIENYISSNKIKNVYVEGRYEKQEEERIYNQADLINMLLSNKRLNSRTCLSNRLYNSSLYGKPMIVFKGSYLGEIIQKYNLGLVLDSFEDIEGKIINYIENFNKMEYDKGRVNFWNRVLIENNQFIEMLSSFIND